MSAERAPRTHWTDERLNDWAAEVMMLKSMPIRVGQLAEEVNGLRRELDGHAKRTERDINGLGERFDRFEERLDATLQAIGTEQAEHRGAEKGAEKATGESHRQQTHWTDRLQAAALIAAVLIAVVSLVVSTAHP